MTKADKAYIASANIVEAAANKADEYNYDVTNASYDTDQDGGQIIIVLKPKPPDLGVHIREGIGTGDKVGG